MNKYAVILVSLFFIAFSRRVMSQSSGIIGNLNNLVKPIKTLDPSSSFDDLEPLKKSLSGKEIVGLGEVSHGTHEVFQYKDRLIRMLVSELGFTAIAFEADYSTAESVNAYISGTADSITTTGGFPLTKEFRAAFRWLREYNNSAQVKVEVFGLESRGYNNIANSILQAFSPLDQVHRAPLEKLANENYYSITKKDIHQVKAILTDLYARAKKSNAKENMHYLDLLNQFIDHEAERKSKYNGYRDEYMAENAAWIRETTSHKKIIISAHNGHVARNNLFKHDTMGKVLNEKYPDRYYVIATDFGEGEVSQFIKKGGKYQPDNVLYKQPEDAKVYEYYFGKLKFPNFMLNVNEATENAILKAFLSKAYKMRIIGGTDEGEFTRLAIADQFDVVIFIRETTAA